MAKPRIAKRAPPARTDSSIPNGPPYVDRLGEKEVSDEAHNAAIILCNKT
jgi:hypothetical protein